MDFPVFSGAARRDNLGICALYGDCPRYKAEREAAGQIGYISMAMAIAPMLGPMLGGVLDTAFGWRSNFYFYAASGVFLLVLCWKDLGETKPALSSKDIYGSDTAIALLHDPLFWAYSLCSTFSTGAFYIFLTGAPLVAQAEFGASTAALGFFIGTITAGYILGAFIAGRFAPRFAPTTMMLAGRLVACAGLLIGITVLAVGWLSPMVFFGSTIFVGLGNGITMPSSNAGAMSVRPKLAGTAAGLNGAMIVAGGAVLTTITGLALPEKGAAIVLLALMLFASAAGLVSVLWAIRIRGT